GKLQELAHRTGGPGNVARSFARKSKARQKWAAQSEETPELEATTADPVQAVIFDCELTPSQLANLQRATGVEVLDRSGVIIEIFSRHAHTREARLQVEIARLKYLAPRMRLASAGGE